MSNSSHDSSYDVVIVGAGITGMSIAWRLATSGASTLVIDRVGIGSGATSIQPGGIRTQWGNKATVDLALESREFYLDFAARTGTGQNPALQTCGYLFVASKQQTLETLRTVVAQQNAWGVSSREVTPEEIAELVPGLDTDGLVGGTFNDQDGYVDHPGTPVSGFADAAAALGAQVLIDKVQAVRPAGSAWEVVLADGEIVRAGRVVLAAGAESANLLRGIGVDVPISSDARFLFYSNPIRERLIEPLVIFQDEHFAVKQLSDGSILASDLRLAAPVGDQEVTWRRHVTDTARRVAPILEFVSLPVMVTGFYDVTPDAQLVLGTPEGADGLTVAAGLNGRGMMLAPAVSRIVAGHVLGSTESVIPEAMDIRRFSRPSTNSTETLVI